MDSGWFRSLGQRSKGCSSPVLTPIPEGKNEGDNSHNHRRQHSSSPFSPKRHRARPAVHKVSSFLALNLGGGGRNKDYFAARSSPTPTTGTLSSAEDASEQQENRPPRRGCLENTWYNPSLMQIVETVQVAMMSSPDPLAPIPVKYNSYVLRLAEGLAHTIEQVRELELALGELKNVREKELEQFRGISDEWIERENGYKAEIKRLEILLANESKDGMASVVLARSGTLVDRSGSKRFQATLKRMSNPEEQAQEKLLADGSRQKAVIRRRDSHHKTIENIPRILDHNSDVIMSQTLARGGKTRPKAHMRRGRAPTSHLQSHDKTQPQPGYFPTGTDCLTQRRIQISRPRAAVEEHGSSSSSSSTPSNYSTSTEDEDMELHQRSHLALEAAGPTGSQVGGESNLGAATRGDDQESLGSVDPGKPGLQRTFFAGPRRRTRRSVGGREAPGSVDQQHMNTSRETCLAISCEQSGTSESFTGGNYFDPSARDAGQHDASGAMPRSINGQQLLISEEDYLSPVQPQPQIQRQRRFSFEAGDNDVLPLAPAANEIPHADAHARLAPVVEKLSKPPVASSVLACEEAPPSRGLADLASAGLQASSRLYRKTTDKTASQMSVEDTSAGCGTLPIHASGPNSTARADYEKIPSSDSTGSVIYVGGGTNGSGNYVSNDDKTSSDAGSLHIQEPPSSGDVHLGDGLGRIKHIASSAAMNSEAIRDEDSDKAEAKNALRTDALASMKGASSVVTGTLRRGGVVAAPRGSHHTPRIHTPTKVNTGSRGPESRSSSSATSNILSPVTKGASETISIHTSAGPEMSGRAAQIAAARAVARGNRRELDKQTQRVPESG